MRSILMNTDYWEHIVLPPFYAEKTYYLLKIEAVIVGNQATVYRKVMEETENVKKDFPENLTELQLGEDRQLRLYVAGRKDLRAIETKNKDKAEWLFENRQCPSCTKTLYLSIEDESESTITYLMQSEDDNSPFAYRFIFRRIKK